MKYSSLNDNFANIQTKACRVNAIPVTHDTVNFKANYDPPIECIQDYFKKLNKTFDDAKMHIESELRQGKTGVVVLDIDGTVLASKSYDYLSENILTGVGSDTSKLSKTKLSSISKALDQAKTAKLYAEKNDYYPAINKAKEFINWLEENNIEYVFLTSTFKRYEHSVLNNLRSEGLINKRCLRSYFNEKESGDSDIVINFKQGVIESLDAQKGILAIIGNSPQDMRLFKKDDGSYKWEIDNTRHDCFLFESYFY